ncbi:MAG: hypothetical protein ACK55Z_05240, partial [bacterium]
LITVRIGSPPPDITLTNGRTRLLLKNRRHDRQFLNFWPPPLTKIAAAISNFTSIINLFKFNYQRCR